MGVYVYVHLLLFPLYGLGRSYFKLYYPAQPPLFSVIYFLFTRTDIIPET